MPQALRAGDHQPGRQPAAREGGGAGLVLQPAPKGKAHDAAWDPTADAGRRVLAGGRRERRHAAAAPRAADERAVRAGALRREGRRRRFRCRCHHRHRPSSPKTGMQALGGKKEKERRAEETFFETQGRRGKTNKHNKYPDGFRYIYNKQNRKRKRGRSRDLVYTVVVFRFWFLFLFFKEG